MIRTTTATEVAEVEGVGLMTGEVMRDEGVDMTMGVGRVTVFLTIVVTNIGVPAVVTGGGLGRGTAIEDQYL